MFGHNPEEKAYYDNQAMRTSLNALQGQLAPNFANLYSPVSAIRSGMAVGDGNKLVPGVGYQQAMNQFRNHADFFNQAQDRTAMMMSGPEGEAARQRMASFMQPRGSNWMNLLQQAMMGAQQQPEQSPIADAIYGGY